MEAEAADDRTSLPHWSWWSSRLGRDARRKAPALLPVHVVPDAPAGFEVRLAGGRTVVVPASFDETALRRIVAALEGAAC